MRTFSLYCSQTSRACCVEVPAELPYGGKKVPGILAPIERRFCQDVSLPTFRQEAMHNPAVAEEEHP
eukprot:1968721-Amphidinium_carterae.1